MSDVPSVSGDSYKNTVDYKRRLRAMTEQFGLVNVTINYCEVSKTISDIVCKLVTHTNREYNVTVWRDLVSFGSECDCSDCFFRGVTCKHIYWLGYRYFGSVDPVEWRSSSINRFIAENWIKQDDPVGNGRNRDCPVCLEELYYDAQLTVRCSVCCNSVHSKCWKRFYDVTGNSTCLFCRTELVPYMY